MDICFLVSGIPRSFYNNLHVFFIELNYRINFDVYINFSEDNDNNYSNKSIDLNKLNNFSFYKNIITTPNIEFNKFKNDNNILNQWSRFYKIFK